MPLVQVRNVSQETVVGLKARAAEQGLTMAAYLRGELDQLASRPTNAQLVARLRGERPRNGPTSADSVAEIRSVRSVS